MRRAGGRREIVKTLIKVRDVLFALTQIRRIMCFAFLTYVRFSDKSNENSRQYRPGEKRKIAARMACARSTTLVEAYCLDFRD